MAKCAQAHLLMSKASWLVMEANEKLILEKLKKFGLDSLGERE